MKPSKTLADYVTIALSPALIMALVGSLVFFLLEVLYVGQYSERLQWTLFFFVFAIVLISRIAIELGSARATLYGLALAAVVFVALQAYVEYPGGSPLAVFSWAINLAVMAIAWWCANRLTWDCTHIEDSVDATGKGVLEAAGLDEPNEDSRREEPSTKSPEEDAVAAQSSGFWTWWDRYRHYVEEQRRKPHTPGVWVVYFSLAALPLFGLGQALIPSAQEERRRYAFWLLVCYVASGLGLLLTTSFLGLRRYLRQRKLKMPVAMTGMWMALGGALIVLVLLVGALLPRPYGEYQLINFKPLGSEERDASQYAVMRDSSGKGDGSPSSEPVPKGGKPKPGSGNQLDKEGKPTGGSQESGGKSGKDGSDAGSQQGDRQGSQGKGNSQAKGGSKGNANSQDKQNPKGEGEKDSEAKDREGQRSGTQSKEEQEQKREQDSGGSSINRDFFQHKPEQSPSSKPSPPQNPVSGLLTKLGWLATVLKWIVFTVLALAVAFFVLRSGLQFLANFTNWARNLLNALQAWWQGLFGQRTKEQAAAAEEELQEQAVTPLPFAAFSNPFTDGSVDRLTPNELTRYSFEALQSWAWEHGLGRRPEETPIEFAERLAEEAADLATEVRRLSGLYTRVAYARATLTTSSLSLLKQFWQRIETSASGTVST